MSYRSEITTRTWVIDSGASHIYGNNLRDFRKSSVKETNMIIKLGDDHQVQTEKKGIVHLGGVDNCNGAGSGWAPDSGQDEDRDSG